eukprot:GHVL01027346.1.p2 GENE.GHVL01027346.1~~GHVL01027346.1.p2  ORF type:complete len:186 (-),score=50.65 GHVL01027346.1:1320-1877(-)
MSFRSILMPNSQDDSRVVIDLMTGRINNENNIRIDYILNNPNKYVNKDVKIATNTAKLLSILMQHAATVVALGGAQPHMIQTLTPRICRLIGKIATMANNIQNKDDNLKCVFLTIGEFDAITDFIVELPPHFLMAALLIDEKEYTVLNADLDNMGPITPRHLIPLVGVGGSLAGGGGQQHQNAHL